MRDGPRRFPQDFSCPAVLRYPLRVRLAFAYVAITLFGRSFQTASASQRIGNSTVAGPTTPSPARSARCVRCWVLGVRGVLTSCFSLKPDTWHLSPCVPCSARFGLFRFRSPLLSESLLFSLPPGTEMVHFPGFASAAYGFSGRFLRFAQEGCPIRRSPDLGLLASSRGLSQLATSFIACLRQGIHRTPLVA